MEMNRIDLKKKKEMKKEAVVEEIDANFRIQEDEKPKIVGASGGDGGAGKKSGVGGGGGGGKCCFADKCTADLTEAKQYHRRHKVCEHHAKAQVVVVDGIRQRFCQQCSRFHEISEFDETKRSCRRRLAGHNLRRRKNSSDPQTAESSSRKATDAQLKEMVCSKVVDDTGRIQMSVQRKSGFKHFHIR